MSAPPAVGAIRWGADGLIPVVATDAATGDVLMVASMNAEALARTRETGIVHYWSRSRAALWRKGETSGHEQRLKEIRVNCNRDSLLLVVEQRGAVCHDGYPTCYYRRLDPDGSLAVVRERAFDPADVYGSAAGIEPGGDGRDQVSLWFGAYLALRDGDLAAVSGTARLLQDDANRIPPRVADELEELAGVLDGSHVHAGFASDARLEAGQCLYWLALAAIGAGIDLPALLAAPSLSETGDMTREGTAGGLRRLAAAWRDEDREPPSLLRQTVPLVVAAARAGGADLDDLLRADLVELRAKPYLTAYFAASAAS